MSMRERTPEERFRSLSSELRQILEAGRDAHVRARDHQASADDEFEKVRIIAWKLSMFGVSLRTIALGLGVSKSQAHRLVAARRR